MTGKNLYYGGIYGAREYSINADTANTAIDLSQSNVYNISLSANTTVSFLNPTSTHYIFVIEQTVGSNTITWPDIKWKSGVPPTLSTTIGSKDTISIIYDGEEYYGFSSADYQTGFRLLDYYPDAAAAYSLRELSQEWIGQPVVRVRRSSDNAERDFTSAEITDGTLLTWVNTEVVIYSSDFSVTDDLFEIIGTGAGNIDGIGGVDDTYRFTLSGGLGNHRTGISNIVPYKNTYTLTVDYYIPSTNTTVDSIWLSQMYGYASDLMSGPTDTWNTHTYTWTNTTIDSYNDVYFMANDLVGDTFNINADGDVFYLKNIVVTQLTADGHVVTWYDQSGNGNNLTQVTSTSQPKLVSAGVTEIERGQPTITTDGVNDFMIFTTPLNLDDLSLFVVAQGSSNSNNMFSRVGSASGTLDVNTTGPSFGFDDFNGGGHLLFTGVISSSYLAVVTRNPSNETYGYINTTSATNNPVIVSTNWIPNQINIRNSIYAMYKYQEIIIYGVDQSGNRLGISSNINSHYSIY